MTSWLEERGEGVQEGGWRGDVLEDFDRGDNIVAFGMIAARRG